VFTTTIVGAVKGTAVSSTWVDKIIATSKNKLQDEEDDDVGSLSNRKGIDFDAKLV
jgi:hypothetical protein